MFIERRKSLRSFLEYFNFDTENIIIVDADEGPIYWDPTAHSQKMIDGVEFDNEGFLNVYCSDPQGCKYCRWNSSDGCLHCKCADFEDPYTTCLGYEYANAKGVMVAQR